MGFKFLLRFTGLCAFVPHTTGRRARVLLLSGADCGGHDHMGGASEVHRPVVIFDKKNLAASSARQPDLSFPFELKERGLCLLEGQDMEIQSTSTDPFVLEGTTAHAGAVCPTGSDRTRLSWVAPIEHIRRGAGKVAADCLGSHGVPSEISARVRLTHGTLRTQSLSQFTGGVIRWKFLPIRGGATGHEQALAEVVELEMNIPGDHVILSTTPFRQDAAHKPPLRLVPAAGGSGVVIATIKSIPLEDALGIRPVEPVVIGQSRARDTHFEHFFRISAADPGPGHGLVPNAVDICAALGAEPPILRSPQCPPSWFEPSSAA